MEEDGVEGPRREEGVKAGAREEERERDDGVVTTDARVMGVREDSGGWREEEGERRGWEEGVSGVEWALAGGEEVWE